jgi:hypothetical protein
VFSYAGTPRPREAVVAAAAAAPDGRVAAAAHGGGRRTANLKWEKERLIIKLFFIH